MACLVVDFDFCYDCRNLVSGSLHGLCPYSEVCLFAEVKVMSGVHIRVEIHLERYRGGRFRRYPFLAFRDSSPHCTSYLPPVHEEESAKVLSNSQEISTCSIL